MRDELRRHGIAALADLDQVIEEVKANKESTVAEARSMLIHFAQTAKPDQLAVLLTGVQAWIEYELIGTSMGDSNA